MTDIATIQPTIHSILSERLALNRPITQSTSFHSLGADSLDIVEIVMTLESVFGITIQDAELENIDTIQDVIDLVTALRA